MTAAIIFIPPDLPDDWRCNIEGQAYLARRGYRYAGVYRLWQDVEIVLAQGEVSCVIIVRREHDPGRGWPIEVADIQRQRGLPPPLDAGVRERHGTVNASTVRATAAPFDESPTVAILSSRRDRMLSNEPTVRLLPRGDDGGFAERFLRDRRQRSRHMNDT